MLQAVPERRKRSTDSKSTSEQNLFTHCPKDDECDMYNNDPRTMRARCPHRPESQRYGDELTKMFGEVIAADLKVLSEDTESRLQHRHAVVVQNLFS